MNCRKCNKALTGTEDFCPFCGTAQKNAEIKATPVEEKADATPAIESSIFQSEPVYIYAEPPKEKKDAKTKIAITMVSLFLLTLLVVSGLSLARYFNLTPAFSSLFSTLPTEEKNLQDTTLQSEFNNSIGLVSPDISLKSTLCTVANEKGLPLRKGPDNSYAQIEILSPGASLQVTGKSLQNDLWVYVYVPSLDLYGWINGSYISLSSSLKEPDTTEFFSEESDITAQ